MRLKTLITMDWGWAWRFFLKRLRHQFAYQVTRPLRSYYEADFYGTKLKLGFSASYHHMRARDMAQGVWEDTAIMPVWMKAAKESSLIFDVGGYNGIYGLLAAKVNPNANIYIFEGDATNIEHIKRNVGLNHLENVRVIFAAVSDKTGTLRFTQGGSTGSKIADWGESVDAVRLDSFGSPDLLKLDVEGHEPQALKGADLSNTKAIFVEINGPETLAMLPQFKKDRDYGNNSILRR